jgi:hypothetical protein
VAPSQLEPCHDKDCQEQSTSAESTDCLKLHKHTKASHSNAKIQARIQGRAVLYLDTTVSMGGGFHLIFKYKNIARYVISPAVYLCTRRFGIYIHHCKIPIKPTLSHPLNGQPVSSVQLSSETHRTCEIHLRQWAS